MGITEITPEKSQHSTSDSHFRELYGLSDPIMPEGYEEAPSAEEVDGVNNIVVFQERRLAAHLRNLIELTPRQQQGINQMHHGMADRPAVEAIAFLSDRRQEKQERKELNNSL